MVTAMVCAFSYLYISQIMRLRISNAYETATNLTHQLAYAAGNAVPDFSSTAVDTSDPASVNRAVADYVQTDVDLNNLLQSDPGDWRFIYDVAILDTNGKALLHTNASMVGRIVPPRPDFQQVVRARFRDQIRLVFSPAAVYDVSYPLTLNGAPFGTIRIGVQTIFLKSEVATRMMRVALHFPRGRLRILAARRGNFQPCAWARWRRSTEISTASAQEKITLSPTRPATTNMGW